MQMNGYGEVGERSIMVEKASPPKEMIEKEGDPKVLNWVLDFGEGERLHSLGCFSKTPLAFLKKGVGEGSKEVQEVQVVRVGDGSCLNSASGGEKVSFLECGALHGRRVERN